MSKQSELPCWEIIQCDRKDKCLLTGEAGKSCWEIVREDSAYSFHICIDCLVYLAKQKNSIFSEEEFCSILNKREKTGFRHYDCKMAYTLRHSTSIVDSMC